MAKYNRIPPKTGDWKLIDQSFTNIKTVFNKAKEELSQEIDLTR